MIGWEDRPIWQGWSTAHLPPTCTRFSHYFVCRVFDKPEVTGQGSFGEAFYKATPRRQGAIKRLSGGRLPFFRASSRGSAGSVLSLEFSCAYQNVASALFPGHRVRDLGGRRRERGDHPGRQSIPPIWPRRNGAEPLGYEASSSSIRERLPQQSLCQKRVWRPIPPLTVPSDIQALETVWGREWCPLPTRRTHPSVTS